MKKKVDIRNLEIGMFVVELDRPWLESPFLFQGFLIENEEELDTLRELCEYVFVDTDRSVHVPDIAKPEAVAFRPARRPASSRERETDPRVFTADFRNAIKAHRQAELGLIQLIDQRRLGKLVDTGPIRDAVETLTEAVIRNPNAALWLTKLREQDEFTSTHCINVAILSIAFGQYLGMPREKLHAIGLGAMLHDIGLTGASNDIIRRASRLTEDEFRVVKRHPVDGLFSLKRLNEMDSITRDVIRWHHERLDGSGYPDGLKGAQIPDHVKVVGIADVYDAMASDRAYRRGMQPSQALTELHKDADRTFGREMVQAFIQCIGIYPVGSVVRLNTGAVAMIASTIPGQRLTPLVLLLKDSVGQTMNPRRLVSLSLAQRSGRDWSIQKVVDPADYRINIASIAMDEMRAFR